MLLASIPLNLSFSHHRGLPDTKGVALFVDHYIPHGCHEIAQVLPHSDHPHADRLECEERRPDHADKY